jgi:uncharacterized iron-regulated membrane protein
VVSLTGVYIAFPQEGRQLLGAIAPMTPVGPRPAVAQPMQQTALAIDRALDMALAAEPRARPAAIFLPSRQAPVWRIVLVRPDAAESVTVTVDDASAAVKMPEAQALSGDRIAQWIRWLHEGSHSGLVWRFAVFCSGLFPAVFFVTGTMIWLRRRRPRAAIAPASLGGRAETASAGS